MVEKARLSTSVKITINHHPNTNIICHIYNTNSIPNTNIHYGWWCSHLCATLATLWTVACQAPLSMGFPRQDYWSGWPNFFFRGSSQPGRTGSPELLTHSLPTEPSGKPIHCEGKYKWLTNGPVLFGSNRKELKSFYVERRVWFLERIWKKSNFPSFCTFNQGIWFASSRREWTREATNSGFLCHLIRPAGFFIARAQGPPHPGT